MNLPIGQAMDLLTEVIQAADVSATCVIEMKLTMRSHEAMVYVRTYPDMVERMAVEFHRTHGGLRQGTTCWGELSGSPWVVCFGAETGV